MRFGRKDDSQGQWWERKQGLEEKKNKNNNKNKIKIKFFSFLFFSFPFEIFSPQNPVLVKAVRIRRTGPQRNWLVVREILLE